MNRRTFLRPIPWLSALALYAEPPLNFRPNFQRMWALFQDVGPPTAPIANERDYAIESLRKTGAKIGGAVKANLDIGIADIQQHNGAGGPIYPPNPKGFLHTCAIRLSYVLNNAGVVIPKSSAWRTVSGGDRRNYIFTVREMKLFLYAKLGPPDIERNRATKPADFAGHKGIIVFDIHFLDATGHSTLWNGSRTVDQEELDPAQLPCSAARLWKCA